MSAELQGGPTRSLPFRRGEDLGLPQAKTVAASPLSPTLLGCSGHLKSSGGKTPCVLAENLPLPQPEHP